MGLFGGSSQDVSSAQGNSQVSLNSSGWVVGTGNAGGGNTSSSQGQIPVIGWLSLAAVGLAFWRYRVKNG